MFLEQIKLNYFRNYIEEAIQFNSNKIIVLGQNAQGKSNLLEAIQLFSTLKSYRTIKDQDFIYQNRLQSEISGQINKKYSNYNLKIKIPQKGRKELIVNEQKQNRQIDFLGIINTVSFSSLDLDLIRGTPEYRRTWIDSLLVQLEPIYLYIIREYQQVLKQRNALLRQLKLSQENSNFNSSLNHLDMQLSIWDDKLIATACRVIIRRNRVIERLEPLAKLWHQKISNNQEKLVINYLCNIPKPKGTIDVIKDQIKNKITENRAKELIIGKTLVGPHRDDLELIINGTTAKNYASQGQQRTLILALKLAELELIEDVIGESPLLLLDDVMAELDLNRQKQLLDSLGDRFQTIITTTHLNNFSDKLLDEGQIFEVKKGRITSK